MKKLQYLILAIACAALATSIFYVGRAVVSVVGPVAPISGAGEIGRSVEGVVVRSAVREAWLNLGEVKNTLVLLFSPDCGACDANMANWIDILADVDSDRLGVMALGNGEAHELQDYWSPFQGRLPVFVIDSSAGIRTGFRGTPTTALINNGRVTAEYVGILNRNEIAELKVHIRRHDRRGG